MSGEFQIPQNKAEFETCWADVASVIDFDVRLPGSPFRATHGTIRIGQFERLLGSDFVPVLEALADAHGDSGLTVVVREPEPEYYRRAYSHFPAVQFAYPLDVDRFWEGISHRPQGDPTGAIVDTANVVAIAGSTRTWSVWGERSWDLFLVHSPSTVTGWTEADFPFVSAEEALDDFTVPQRSGLPLAADVRAAFLANFASR